MLLKVNGRFLQKLLKYYIGGIPHYDLRKKTEKRVKNGTKFLIGVAMKL